jgi:hypothetical protein
MAYVIPQLGSNNYFDVDYDKVRMLNLQTGISEPLVMGQNLFGMLNSYVLHSGYSFGKPIVLWDDYSFFTFTHFYIASEKRWYNDVWFVNVTSKNFAYVNRLKTTSGSDLYVEAATFTPDRTRILMATSAGIYVLDLRFNTVTYLFALEYLGIWGLAHISVAPDAGRVVVAYSRDVLVFNAATKLLMFRSASLDSSIASVAVDYPGGVAYVAAGSGLWLLNLTSAAWTQLAALGADLATNVIRQPTRLLVFVTAPTGYWFKTFDLKNRTFVTSNSLPRSTVRTSHVVFRECAPDYSPATERPTTEEPTTTTEEPTTTTEEPTTTTEEPTTTTEEPTTTTEEPTTTTEEPTTTTEEPTTTTEEPTTTTEEPTTTTEEPTTTTEEPTTTTEEPTTTTPEPTTPEPTTTTPEPTTPEPTTTTPEPTPEPTPPKAVIAEVTIARTYTEVCFNLSTYVDGICDGLRISNPDDEFSCQAQALNGIQCPDGVCPCTVQRRRLLQDSCNLSTSVSHTSTQPIAYTEMPPWVAFIAIIIPPLPQEEPASETSMWLVVGVAAAVVAVIVAAVVLLIRNLPPPQKTGLLTQLKMS